MKHQIGNSERKRRTPIRDNSDLVKLANSYTAPPKTVEPKIQEPSKIIIPKDLTNSDYIALNNQIFSIGLYETNKNWYNQAKSTLEKGLQFQDVAQGMEMYKAIINAHQNKQTLFHPDGTNVHEKIISELYNLTQDNCQNLNARFKENNLMKKAPSLDSNKNLIYSESQIIAPKKDGYYNLEKINSQGFPIEKSKTQLFHKNNNIYVRAPINGRVARLVSINYDSILYCYDVPENNDASLGVRYSIVRGQGSDKK
mgnify:CR=1 FL=1